MQKVITYLLQKSSEYSSDFASTFPRYLSRRYGFAKQTTESYLTRNRFKDLKCREHKNKVLKILLALYCVHVVH